MKLFTIYRDTDFFTMQNMKLFEIYRDTDYFYHVEDVYGYIKIRLPVGVLSGGLLTIRCKFLSLSNMLPALIHLVIIGLILR